MINRGYLAIFVVLLISSLLIVFSVEESECKVDSDCVKVQTTCCSCNMGGEEMCVPIENVSYYEEKLEECGEGLFCAAVYNCEIESCGCVKGKCVG